MNPERWQRIEEIFGTVVDRPLAERRAYLTSVCGGDEELHREVLELLDHETADGFLEEPIKHATLAVTNEPADEMLGQRIGAYRLIRLIGRGGMGTVYEAVRDDRQLDTCWQLRAHERMPKVFKSCLTKAMPKPCLIRKPSKPCWPKCKSMQSVYPRRARRGHEEEKK